MLITEQLKLHQSHHLVVAQFLGTSLLWARPSYLDFEGKVSATEGKPLQVGSSIY